MDHQEFIFRDHFGGGFVEDSFFVDCFIRDDFFCGWFLGFGLRWDPWYGVYLPAKSNCLNGLFVCVLYLSLICSHRVSLGIYLCQKLIYNNCRYFRFTIFIGSDNFYCLSRGIKMSLS